MKTPDNILEHLRRQLEGEEEVHWIGDGVEVLSWVWNGVEILKEEYDDYLKRYAGGYVAVDEETKFEGDVIKLISNTRKIKATEIKLALPKNSFETFKHDMWSWYAGHNTYNIMGVTVKITKL